MSKNKYRYIDRKYGIKPVRRWPRPLLAVFAVLAVGGLAVPAALASQWTTEQEPPLPVGPTETWAQQTSGVAAERKKTPSRPKPSKTAPPPAETAAPVQPPKPVPVSSATGLVPGRVLDLRAWKLALPIDTPHAGTPDEIKPAELANFVSRPYFYAAQGGVVFQAHAGGATTKNSSYPRSELREMTLDGGNAAWSNTTGVHTMTIRQAIMQTPKVKPHVVAGQIHDGSDDVIMIRLEGSHLFVEADGKPLATLQQGYTLGTPFTVKIETSGGQIRVLYNGVQKLAYDRPGSGFFFKAGVYTQSNPSRGDSPDAFGQVVIYSLSVTHG